MLRRLLATLPSLLILSVISFGLVKMVPGDVVGAQSMGSLGVSRQQLDTMRTYLGLDRPIHVQYLDWLAKVIRLDLGDSFLGAQPVAYIIRMRLVPTMLLTGTALLESVILGILFGVLAARWRNSIVDYSVTTVSFFFVSIPAFWAGIMAIILFSITLRVLPAGMMTSPGQPPAVLDVLHHLILPATVLGLGGMASITRYVRSSMIEVMEQDYIRTARSKGLSERIVLVRHALRNALLPVATIIGLRLPSLVGGSVLIEQVFSWPGLGQMGISAARSRDFPITMGLVLVVGTLTIVGNLLADLSYYFLDPRIEDLG
ncbi:MAG: ABC transporter permease [Chloroflexota bacterium]